MARHLTRLVLVVFLVGIAVLAKPEPVAAYHCPIGSHLITTPAGTYPPYLDETGTGTEVCVTEWSQSTFADDQYPCGEYVNIVPTNGLGSFTYFLTPEFEPNTPYHVAFYITLMSLTPEDADDYSIYWGYVDTLGNTNLSNEIDLDPMGYELIWDIFNLVAVRVYSFDTSISAPSEAAGVVIATPFPLDFGFFSYGIASFRFGQSIPVGCDIDSEPQPTPTPQPYPTLPATWTPLPGGTPQPTWTPHPTYTPTLTPLATATGGILTYTPFATPTRITFPQLPAEPTATRWTIPTLAPLEFAPVFIPELPPINTPIPNEVISVTVSAITEDNVTVAWEMAEEAGGIATAWAGPVGFAEDTLFSTGIYTEGRPVTATVPISNTAENVSLMLSSITYPMRFLKTIQVYMPNTWILVLVVLACFLIILITLIVKFGMAIIGDVLGVIRDIWEAIPLN